ncbi:MAG: ATPase domain-containing protein [Promethearchaeota archaeon]
MPPEHLLNINENQILDLNNLIKNHLNNKKSDEQISTGTNNLDDVLGGGLCFGKIYLVYGTSKTGKTQFCHQMSIQAIMNKKLAYYLDTENTFRVERITEMVKNLKISPELILKNIFVSKIMSSSMLLLSLNDIEEKFSKGNNQVLIIDTINNYFRFDQGDENSSFHKTKSNFLNALEKLSTITQKFNLITIVTAQISSNFINDSIIRDIPVGNQFLNHYISEYLYLRLEEEKVNSAHLVNSQYLPEKKQYFKITSSGLEDFNIK